MAFENIKKMFKNFTITSKEDVINFEATLTLLESNKTIRIEGGEMVEGAKVFIITKDTEIPIPDETWALSNGYTITTVAGAIVSFEETTKTNDATPDVIPEAEVDAADVATTDAPAVTPVPDAPAGDLTGEKIAELETKITDLSAKLDEVISKLDGMMSKTDKLEQDYQAYTKDTEMKFEKVSSVQSLQKLSKEVVRKENSNLGSYDEIKNKLK